MPGDFSSHYRQLLRDSSTNQFLDSSGQWTASEHAAANHESITRIVQLRLEHAERCLELLLKRPGQPDLTIAL